MAASRATPAPTIPPPTTSTSTGSAASAPSLPARDPRLITSVDISSLPPSLAAPLAGRVLTPIRRTNASQARPLNLSKQFRQFADILHDHIRRRIGRLRLLARRFAAQHQHAKRAGGTCHCNVRVKPIADDGH